jgi:hypothetical protein
VWSDLAVFSRRNPMIDKSTASRTDSLPAFSISRYHRNMRVHQTRQPHSVWPTEEAFRSNVRCQPNRARFGWAASRALVSRLTNPAHVTTPQTSTDMGNRDRIDIRIRQQWQHSVVPFRMSSKRRSTGRGVHRMELSRNIFPSHGH